MGQARKSGAAAWKPLLVLALLALLVFLWLGGNRYQRENEALSRVTPAPTLSPPPLQFQQLAPMYRFGSVGPEVVALQQRLSQLGYYTAEIDGQYYQGTQAAVKAFQLQHGLDADGIAGEQTLRVLQSPAAQPYRPPAGTEAPSAPPPGAYQTPPP